jgi:glycerol-3-phosphate dehydrogenase
MEQMETEVLIIGGGVLGAAVARELSRYKVDVVLTEKEADFGWGSTKTNMCIVCQGADTLEFRPEYRRSRLVWDSMPLMEPLCQELDVPFKRIGEMALIRNNEELAKFQKMKSRAEKIGLKTHEFIDQKTLRQREPNITRAAIGAMYDPNIAIVDPVRLTIALVENAAKNEVHVMRETEVLAISPQVNQFEVQTTRGLIQCRFIVNAAGTSVDKIARLVNSDDFVLYPIRGYVGILDKNLGDLINHEIHMRPDAPGQMNILTPSVHGNLFFGTTMQPAWRGDYSTTRRISEIGFQNARKIVPDLSEKEIIHSFAGFLMFRNWEIGWHECVVQASRNVPRFVSVCIGYPGVSAAPAAAREVVKLLQQESLTLGENPRFTPYRRAAPVFSELPEEQQREWVTKDNRYGHLVCRCETVTEGEIVEATRRGATTLDGIKFRTRAGMGRCQGGFCTPRVVKILAMELGLQEEKITKKGRESRLLLHKSKELIEAGI